MNVYYGDWAGAPRWHGLTGRKALEHDFNTKLPSGIKILFAWYSQEEYEGNAFVLFRHGGKLYEVSGGHCSCYGLEDQWIPVETNVQVLHMRQFYGMDEETRGALDTLLARLEMTDEDTAA